MWKLVPHVRGLLILDMNLFFAFDPFLPDDENYNYNIYPI